MAPWVCGKEPWSGGNPKQISLKYPIYRNKLKHNKNWKKTSKQPKFQKHHESSESSHYAQLWFPGKASNCSDRMESKEDTVPKHLSDSILGKKTIVETFDGKKQWLSGKINGILNAFWVSRNLKTLTVCNCIISGFEKYSSQNQDSSIWNLLLSHEYVVSWNQHDIVFFVAPSSDPSTSIWPRGKTSHSRFIMSNLWGPSGGEVLVHFLFAPFGHQLKDQFSVSFFFEKGNHPRVFFWKLSDSFLPLHPFTFTFTTITIHPKFRWLKGTTWSWSVASTQPRWHRCHPGESSLAQPLHKGRLGRGGLWAELPANLWLNTSGSVRYVYGTYHLNIWHVIVWSGRNVYWIRNLRRNFIHDSCMKSVHFLLSLSGNLEKKLVNSVKGIPLIPLIPLIVLKLPSFSLRPDPSAVPTWSRGITYIWSSKCHPST